MKKMICFICVFLVFCACGFAETADAVPQSAPAVVVDVTQIIISVIGLIFSFVLTWAFRAIVPPAKAWLEARTTAEQRSMIYTLIKQLVYAAEQRIGSGYGDAKREFVCSELRNRGIEVDFDLIEAAVKEMNDNLIAEYVTDIDDGHIEEEEAEA